MRKHPFDLVSFVVGLLLVGLATAYIVGAYTDIRIDPRLVLPLVLVGLGLAGLAGSMLAQHRSDRAVAAAADSLAADAGDEHH